MKNLIILPTEVAQWHAIVSEAEESRKLWLSEDLECYLVFLLLRFSNNPQWVKTVFAHDFLEAMKKINRQRREHLQGVGDKCLLFSGLFPGQADRKNVRISYFVTLGRTAYEILSQEPYLDLAKLYESLYTQFVSLMDILQEISKLAASRQELTLKQAQELWNDTGSLYALDVLRNCMSGPIFPDDYSKSNH